jgi:hypothetical protein
MCLAIPGKVSSIQGEDPAFRSASVDFCGVRKVVRSGKPGLVSIRTTFSSTRIVAMLAGDQLPRICGVMHEMGIAASVLKAVREENVRYPGRRAVKVGLRIGEFADVDTESLRFCFEALSLADNKDPVASRVCIDISGATTCRA